MAMVKSECVGEHVAFEVYYEIGYEMAMVKSECVGEHVAFEVHYEILGFEVGVQNILRVQVPKGRCDLQSHRMRG